MQIAESRYGEFKERIEDNTSSEMKENPFQEVLKVVATAAKKICPGQTKFLNDGHEPLHNMTAYL